MDSHTKQAELRESYHLEDCSVGKAFIFVSVAQFLRCGGEALPPVREKWVRASARKKAFGSRLRQAKCSACPTQGWVKSLSHHCRLLSALRGDVVWFLLLFFRRLPAAPKIGPNCLESLCWGGCPPLPTKGAHIGSQEERGGKVSLPPEL